MTKCERLHRAAIGLGMGAALMLMPHHILLASEDRIELAQRSLGDPRAINERSIADKGTSMTFMLLDIEDFALSDSGQPQFENAPENEGVVQDMLNDAAFGLRVKHKF